MTKNEVFGSTLTACITRRTCGRLGCRRCWPSPGCRPQGPAMGSWNIHVWSFLFLDWIYIIINFHWDEKHEQPSICVRLRTCHCLFWEEQDVEKEQDADDVVFNTRFFNDWLLKSWENYILSSHRWIKSYCTEIEMCGLFIYIVNNSILYELKEISFFGNFD